VQAGAVNTKTAAIENLVVQMMRNAGNLEVGSVRLTPRERERLKKLTDLGDEVRKVRTRGVWWLAVPFVSSRAKSLTLLERLRPV
jgi:hypothetical protein